MLKRRAFLTSLGAGGLIFCDPSLAGSTGHHPVRNGRRTAAALPSDAPALATLSASTRQQISHLVSIAPHRSRQERIVLISQAMKGTPYLAQPLIGSATVPEELVLSWRGVNCMTFVEIVLAASLSQDVEQFIHALIATRYSHHHVTFRERRHFLSDWLHGTPVLCHDLSPDFPYARHVEKTLNLKLPSSDQNGPASPERPQATAHEARTPPTGTDRYLPDLPLRKRLITYLPTQPFLNDLKAGGIHGRIRNGDVIGIYSPLPGLDVFHIGLAIWQNHGLYFRNASSLPEHRYVVDSPLDDYVRQRRGLIIYRATP
ncbi:N-acetylmuramoyl-L-alanine amidase-like domain-containing protein [Bombella mellum]|uniref:DUF1460 domain-containing protein n=1 Tax=Bombella mellum TaxID=2039288 RepID=A0ABR5ZSN1_9PROT|nr:N-acetylmuramoyl-L-alanine amidase-like domain-containing protein [Bombella mellum]MBA5727319.1 hypothetical protein [Bombella mellum]